MISLFSDLFASKSSVFSLDVHGPQAFLAGDIVSWDRVWCTNKVQNILQFCA